MHILAAAPRNARAQAHILAASRELAERLDLPGELVSALTVQHNDPYVKQILVAEATANLLEALSKRANGEPLESDPAEPDPLEPATLDDPVLEPTVPEVTVPEVTTPKQRKEK